MSLSRLSTGIAALAISALASPGAYALAFPIADSGDGLVVVAAGGGNIIAKYQGNSAAYSNDLYLEGFGFVFNNHTSLVGSTVDLGNFSAGTELVFRLFVNNTGYSYFTGPASRNPDGQIHARVQSNWEPGTTLVSFEDLYNGPFNFNDLSFSFTNTMAGGVPEPSTWLLMIAGLGLVGGVLRRKSAIKTTVTYS